MLDENLPCFFLRKSTEGVSHHTAIFLTQNGSEPEPVYTLQHADPADPNSRNCYAAAVFDSYNRDVLYGEVLVRPEWKQPTLSQDEIRRNGGVPPPPAPVLPTEFTIQLYNPDQQIVVHPKHSSWAGSTSYEFSMPQNTFRMPSASNLDRTTDDPAASTTTPKINFVWRRESKLSKDLTCFMTGKSTDTIVKKKHRDPDIAIALFRSLREMTIYEPNLYRVEMEDAKGFEVVLLLAAAAIKDIYFGNMKETFNFADSTQTNTLNAGGRKLSSPPLAVSASPLVPGPAAGSAPAGASNSVRRRSLPKLQTTPPASSHSPRPPPPVDARAQWEIDAETARLHAQREAEKREARRGEAARRREREKADEVETRRLRKQFEAEQREAQKRQEAVDRETERLRRQYGVQNMPSLPQRLVSSPSNTSARVQPQRTSHQRPDPSPALPLRGSNGLYLQPPSSSAYASTSMLMSGGNPSAPEQRMKPKKSLFGLRSLSDNAEGNKRLSKKASAMW